MRGGTCLYELSLSQLQAVNVGLYPGEGLSECQSGLKQVGGIKVRLFRLPLTAAWTELERKEQTGQLDSQYLLLRQSREMLPGQALRLSFPHGLGPFHGCEHADSIRAHGWPACLIPGICSSKVLRWKAVGKAARHSRPYNTELIQV